MDGLGVDFDLFTDEVAEGERGGFTGDVPDSLLLMGWEVRVLVGSGVFS